MHSSQITDELKFVAQSTEHVKPGEIHAESYPD
jgi:hypothetical protein